MIRLIFIRHGATAGNLEKRYIGSTDEPLCDIGIAQVEALGKRDLQVDYLYVSPMLRTRQTAQLLFPQKRYMLVDDLRETNFGAFEGKTAAELSSSAEYQAWVGSMCRDPIPQGESMADLKARCCLAFREIMKDIPDGSCVAFVVHGGPIMSILEAYAYPKKGFYDYHIENGRSIEAEYKDGKIGVSE